MKKITTVCFALFLVFGLAACNDEKVENKEKDKKEKEVVSKEVKKGEKTKEVTTSDVKIKQDSNYIEVPKKEVKEAVNDTMDERGVFFENIVELEKMLKDRMANEIVHATFVKQYESTLKILNETLTKMEEKVKKDGYNELEKTYVRYYKEILKIGEKKKHVINEKGEINYTILKEESTEMEKLQKEYEEIFELVPVEKIKEQYEVTQPEPTNGVHTHEDGTTHSHDDGSIHTHEDDTMHSH